MKFRVFLALLLMSACFSTLVNAETDSFQKNEDLGDPDITYAIEVASMKKRTEVLDIYENLQMDFYKLLRAYKPIIEPIDYNNSSYGQLFRLRLGYMRSKTEAEGICVAMKWRGYEGMCSVKFNPRPR